MHAHLPLLLVVALGAVASANPVTTGKLVEGNNRFATDLYGELAKQPGNLFFSPYSISTALGMTYAGARGQTAQEMARTLHFTGQGVHPAFRALFAKQGSKGKGHRLSVANALWGQRGYRFAKPFLNLTKTNYGAGLRELEFAADPERARQTINRWVERKTQAKIKELLQKGIIDSDTRLVLTNAIHFKGDWAAAFKKSATAPRTFHVTADKAVRVPTMHQTHRFPFAQVGKELQVLEMPYKGRQVAMTVLLPSQAAGPAWVEKNLGKLGSWLGRLRPRQVRVALPKLKVTASFRLEKTLQALGMKTPFDPRSADFSGITGKPDLYISAVVHKAFVDVNEEGTEAAASTAVVMGPGRAAVPQPPVVFRADRPFVFLIRDLRTGSVLFLGRVANPGA